MFSTRNSELVSYSDGLFTRCSATTNRINDDLQNDLIEFLTIVQKCNVEFLPITWQPALSNLGIGGSGMICQSTFINEMPLAFKRFHDSENADGDFLPLMSEVLILSQPPIQTHPNIVDLEGVCWEIKPRTKKAVPVLVFEKAAWDLQQFMSVQEGRNMLIEDRLKICADIGSAIMALHSYNIIHGDIKPQNVLVFKDATGTTVKVTDFGYSTLAAAEAGKVLLPKSRPWNAPEYHSGEFKAFEAKKTDVYSFGMLCLWVLFGNRLAEIPQTTAEGVTELISFDAPLRHGRPTLLERLKDEDKVEYIANQLMESMPDLNPEYRIRLKELFSVTLPLNPEKRTSDLGKSVGFLSQEQIELQRFNPGPLETTSELSSPADFRIAEILVALMEVDYRVRIQIRECLENKYFGNQNQPFAANIAFQVAFCYQIGFGIKSDDNASRIWLEKSNKRSEDLEVEKEAVQHANWTSKSKFEFGGKFLKVNIMHEYRTWGLNQLEEARRECEREVGDMAQEFGELHFISLNLYATLGNLLDELGEFAKSKSLRMRIRDQIQKQSGVGSPYFIESIINVTNSHTKLGEWKEAQLLQEKVLKLAESTESLDVPSIKNHLASTYRSQGRWKEAEELEMQVMEMSLRVLGQEHPDTLISMASLASTYGNQGRWKEAEELEVKVIETFKKALGQEHPDTLTSMNNLALTYSSQGRWKEAEELEVQVIKMSSRVLGQEHPSTMTCMANLASTYRRQGRWKEAEELDVQVMETRTRVLGQEHPSTMISMANLASTFWKQGRWKETEELEVRVLEMSLRVLGQEHPDTLISMANLASTYRNQGRWTEAEELEVQVMETSLRVLGQEHPDTLTSMANRASTYRNQGRWKEAKELDVKVMKTRMRVLGEEHPSTLTSMANLASTFSKQGQWKEAEELFVQVMKTTKRIHGQEHPDTLTSMANLASIFSKQGRWKEAEELFVQVIETTKRVLGQEHPDTLTSMINLASTYSSHGLWKEAEELEVQVMEMSLSVYGQEHPDTLTSMNNLASTYRNQGRWEEAEELFVKVIETTKRVLGQEHPTTLTSMANLASTFWKQERWKEAEELQVQVMETRKRVLGEEHLSTMASMANLASIYSSQGRWIQAEELQVQVTNRIRMTLGEDHPSTIAAMANLASIRMNREALRTSSVEN